MKGLTVVAAGREGARPIPDGSWWMEKSHTPGPCALWRGGRLACTLCVCCVAWAGLNGGVRPPLQQRDLSLEPGGVRQRHLEDDPFPRAAVPGAQHPC